ncbi:MAG: TAXI family TRAP transporter solute-binding subunit [Pseudomonadales bacterium]
MRWWCASLLWLAMVGAHAEGLPRTLAWTAYNLGTTGYNQAVAIGMVLKRHYDVSLRVVPGKNDVSRLLPLVRGRVHLSANGIATYFAQEGVFQFAAPVWGPIPVRMVFTSNGEGNQALAVAADTGITQYSELKGRRVPYVRGAPSLNVNTEAMLACGGLGWQDVERVDFPGYNAMWTGIVNDHVDAAFAATVSGPTRKLEASPRGIFWPPVPHDDAACWQRMMLVAPYFSKHIGTRGAQMSVDQPHEGVTYPYPLLIGLDHTDETLVYEMARVIHRHYDEFKDADPGAIGWALDRQLKQWVVPWHQGTVRYFRELGVWSAADEAHNQRLLERQSVLQAAWDEHIGVEDEESDEFQSAWQVSRVAALEAAGFDPVWR